MWETWVFSQLRHRERRTGPSGTRFFWRGRTREVDFVVDAGGRLELYEARWTEIPNEGDCAGLRVVREAVGWKRIAGSKPASVWLFLSVRDRLIHDYFGVDVELVRDVVQTRMPDPAISFGGASSDRCSATRPPRRRRP